MLSSVSGTFREREVGTNEQLSVLGRIESTLNDLTEEQDGSTRFTAVALSNAPTGSGTGGGSDSINTRIDTTGLQVRAATTDGEVTQFHVDFLPAVDVRDRLRPGHRIYVLTNPVQFWFDYVEPTKQPTE